MLLTVVSQLPDGVVICLTAPQMTAQAICLVALSSDSSRST